jgi:pimeloyl-ACP methyl ester carboxylesterase
LLSSDEVPLGFKLEAIQALDYGDDGYSANGRIMKAFPYPESVPVTIIASSRIDDSVPYSREDLKVRLDYFREQKSIHPQIKIIETSKSGHYIHLEEPDLVLEAIRSMLAASK